MDAVFVRFVHIDVPGVQLCLDHLAIFEIIGSRFDLAQDVGVLRSPAQGEPDGRVMQSLTVQDPDPGLTFIDIRKPAILVADIMDIADIVQDHGVGVAVDDFGCGECKIRWGEFSKCMLSFVLCGTVMCGQA